MGFFKKLIKAPLKLHKKVAKKSIGLTKKATKKSIGLHKKIAKKSIGLARKTSPGLGRVMGGNKKAQNPAMGIARPTTGPRTGRPVPNANPAGRTSIGGPAARKPSVKGRMRTSPVKGGIKIR